MVCYLFLPSFVVAFRAVRAGALYGLVVGIVPVILAPLMGYIVPLFLYFIFYMFAPLGGFFGEVTAKIVFKP